MPCIPSSASPLSALGWATGQVPKGKSRSGCLGFQGGRALKCLQACMHGAPADQLHWSVPFAPVVLHLRFVVACLLTPCPPYVKHCSQWQMKREGYTWFCYIDVSGFLSHLTWVDVHSQNSCRFTNNAYSQFPVRQVIIISWYFCRILFRLVFLESAAWPNSGLFMV